MGKLRDVNLLKPEVLRRKSYVEVNKLLKSINKLDLIKGTYSSSRGTQISEPEHNEKSVELLQKSNKEVGPNVLVLEVSNNEIHLDRSKIRDFNEELVLPSGTYYPVAAKEVEIKNKTGIETLSKQEYQRLLEEYSELLVEVGYERFIRTFKLTASTMPEPPSTYRMKEQPSILKRQLETNVSSLVRGIPYEYYVGAEVQYVKDFTKHIVPFNKDGYILLPEVYAHKDDFRYGVRRYLETVLKYITRLTRYDRNLIDYNKGHVMLSELYHTLRLYFPCISVETMMTILTLDENRFIVEQDRVTSRYKNRWYDSYLKVLNRNKRNENLDLALESSRNKYKDAVMRQSLESKGTTTEIKKYVDLEGKEYEIKCITESNCNKTVKETDMLYLFYTQTSAKKTEQTGLVGQTSILILATSKDALNNTLTKYSHNWGKTVIYKLTFAELLPYLSTDEVKVGVNAIYAKPVDKEILVNLENITAKGYANKENRLKRKQKEEAELSKIEEQEVETK